jgi:hypothetical protein
MREDSTGRNCGQGIAYTSSVTLQRGIERKETGRDGTERGIDPV